MGKNKIYWWLVGVIALFSVASLTIIIYPKSTYAHELFKWFLTLLVIVITAWFSIQKYHQEQRTSRIQKLYFEDAFLGQIKAMEETMSQAKENIYCVRSVFHMLEQFLYKGANDSKEILLEKIKNTKNSLALKKIITAFKKEAITDFLYEDGDNGEKFIGWIEAFEIDTASLFYDLEGLLIVMQNYLMRLENFDFDAKNFFEGLKEKVNRVYFIRIERHRVLFSVLSIFVFILTEEHYDSVAKIKISLRKEPRYKELIKFVGYAYKELVEDFIEYTLCSMQALPGNNPEKAKKYMLYLAENRDYIFRDLAGNVQKDSLPVSAMRDLSNLSVKLKEPQFKKDIMFIMSQIHSGFNDRSMDNISTAEELYSKVGLVESEVTDLRRRISKLRKTI